MTSTNSTTVDDGPTADGNVAPDADETADGGRAERHVCRVSGREQGLVGAYDIYLSRQAFREMAADMGFRKYD